MIFREVRLLRKSLQGLFEIVRGYWRALIFIVLLAVVAGAFSAWLFSSEDSFLFWFSNWLVNFSASMTGVFFTLLFIELLLRQRDKQEERDERVELFRQQTEMMRHYAQAQAIVQFHAADDETERKAILNDMAIHDLLRGAALASGDLTHSYLSKADLRDANLHSAKLTRAHLRDSNLSGAQLCNADLSNVDLRNANLSRTDFRDAYLVNARLDFANLAESDLTGANLRDADVNLGQLRHARSLRGTTLPDGTILPFGDDWKAEFEAWCARPQHRKSTVTRNDS
jgi:hypothetical protein